MKILFTILLIVLSKKASTVKNTKKYFNKEIIMTKKDNEGSKSIINFASLVKVILIVMLK